MSNSRNKTTNVMSPKLALAFLLAGSTILVKGQNNAADSIRDSYHIFFPAMGKDILAGRVGGHYYKIVHVYDKPSVVYVDNRLVTGDELTKYNADIERIKSSVKEDDEERQMRQMERDRRQAERDDRQAVQDRQQQQREREQQIRDRQQQRYDQEQHRQERLQQQRDREQVQRDRAQEQQDRAQEQQVREQEQRDRAQEQQDRAQEQQDRIQERSAQGDDGDCRSCDGDWERNEQAQREQSAEDRAMLKKGIQVLVDEHIIGGTQNLRSLVLTDTDVSVNGVRQPSTIYQQMRTRLGDWAMHGLSYGAAGSDNYSLSIND
jgi:DNA repair exonuclease SbcCD ATPase subunit